MTAETVRRTREAASHGVRDAQDTIRQVGPTEDRNKEKGVEKNYRRRGKEGMDVCGFLPTLLALDVMYWLLM